MKTDIDTLMEEKDLDAIFVTGPAQNNPAMVYLTGIAHLTRANLVKKRGEPPVLFHYPMERDEAARTGLISRAMDIPFQEEMMRRYPDDLAQANGLVYQKMFFEAGLERGRVGIYGLNEAGPAFAAFTALQRVMPEIELVGEIGRSVMLSAMETKSPDEIEHIRKIGQTATTIIGQVADLLTSQTVHNQVLVKPDGSPLRIREVKQKIGLWLAEREAENPEGTIFASGYDAGVPHSTGNPDEPLRLGQTIVFDFYPREAGGGYFYDITRTWCLGYAPDEALALYEAVLDVYQAVVSSLRLGQTCQSYQELVCDLFEAGGHPTLRSNPGTTDGYVHSLGHGLGLHIHEQPWFRTASKDEYLLTPGMVFTVEPGLYYPERGLGVRLEDTLWARPDGEFEILAPYPLDLVLPIKG
jgi:Xaa-Pro aminopeptidase